jgi:hypothetical protein
MIGVQKEGVERLSSRMLMNKAKLNGALIWRDNGVGAVAAEYLR